MELLLSLGNYYEDNFDYLRFGRPKKKMDVRRLINFMIHKNTHLDRCSMFHMSDAAHRLLSNYGNDLCWLYENLNNDRSRKLLVDLILYRILGYRHVKLPVNNENYWLAIKKIEMLAKKEDKIHTEFLDWDLYFFDLAALGYDLKLYCTVQGITIGFVLEQYAYRLGDKNIAVEQGDYVIDAGGCWGDSALYFASKIKNSGKVFSFEFIPKNMKIFERNISLNPQYADYIHLIKQPLGDRDDKDAFYMDSGPGSNIRFEKMRNFDGKAKTTTIDKFVEKNKINKIDFIKMDIEGAELYALNGALNTINQFVPKLAIAIYHNVEDFVKIPRWIHELNLGYKLYLHHCTIHTEETVLFAAIE